MNMKIVLSAALLLTAMSANADTSITRGADGGLIVHEIKTESVTAVDEGAGCRTLEELTLAHKTPAVMKHMFGTKRCGIINVGDKLNLVIGANTGNKSVVKVYVADGLFFYVPGYVFGR
jgi:hypothetical protein